MAGARARYKLTESAARSSTFKSIGSLNRGEPAGITAVARPSNVTACSVPAFTLSAPSASAKRAAPIVMAFVPYSFVRRSRTRSPPTLKRTIWRTVWSLKLGVPGNGPAPALGGSGDAPQLPTHFGSCACAASVASSRAAAARRMTLCMCAVPGMRGRLSYGGAERGASAGTRSSRHSR
ncbi:MAG TPA: hypothetical protein VE907_10070 [Gammaproteobacteria bacterium]|nr:hypothetical protein [Gammaproteobacteria bacterium]